MSFLETPRFPDDIGRGSSGGPGHLTNIITTDSGQEQRIARRSSARRTYNVGYGVRSREDMYALAEFYTAVQGPAVGFRFKDWTDYTTASDGVSAKSSTDEELVGEVNGTNKEFQLVKRYTKGVLTRVRNITKPVSGTTAVAINGDEGVASGLGWSVDTTTGLVTFGTAPSIGVSVTGGCDFDVPVRFGEANDELINLVLTHPDGGDVSDVQLVELADGIEIAEEFFFGGAVEEVITANKSISVAEGRVFVLNANAASLACRLPDPTNLPAGGPYFYIFNVSAVNSLALQEHDATPLATIGTQSMVTVILSEATGGTKVWYAF